MYSIQICFMTTWSLISSEGKKYFKCHQCIFAISVLHVFSFGKGRKHSFEKTYILITYMRMPCGNFGGIWSIGSGEEDENVKSVQTNSSTDKGRLEKLTWTFHNWKNLKTRHMSNGGSRDLEKRQGRERFNSVYWLIN